MSDNAKSILKYSSEAGPWMGGYLFLMSACLLGSVHLPALILLMLPLALGMPVVLYLLVRRIRSEAPQYRTVMATWLGGTWICIFGSLICAALTAIWINLFDPDFLSAYLQQCIEAARSANLPAEYATMADTMEQTLKQGRVPSSTQWIFSMIWLTAFVGLVLSLVLSLIMNLRRSPNPEKYP